MLIPQSLNRVEHGGATGGVNAEDDSRHHGDQGRSHGCLEESLGCGKIEAAGRVHVPCCGAGIW